MPRRPSQLSQERQPRGEALVAADGTRVLWAQEGYARLKVANSATRALLARAYQLPGLDAELRDRERLAWEVRTLRRDLLEARRWACWQYHQRGAQPSAERPSGAPPAWLTDPTLPASRSERGQPTHTAHPRPAAVRSVE